MPAANFSHATYEDAQHAYFRTMSEHSKHSDEVWGRWTENHERLPDIPARHARQKHWVNWVVECWGHGSESVVHHGTWEPAESLVPSAKVTT